MNPSETVEPCGVCITRSNRSCIMASEQDGGFCTSVTDRASLERYGEINPQPNRADFEQVMNSLDVLYPLEEKRTEIKTQNANVAAQDLVGEEETTVKKIPMCMSNVLPGPMAKGYMAKNDEKGLFEQSKETIKLNFRKI
jgi:hypothetical protein